MRQTQPLSHFLYYLRRAHLFNDQFRGLFIADEKVAELFRAPRRLVSGNGIIPPSRRAAPTIRSSRRRRHYRDRPNRLAAGACGVRPASRGAVGT